MLTKNRIALATAVLAIAIIKIAAVFPGFLPDQVPAPCKQHETAPYDDCSTIHIVLFPFRFLGWLGEEYADAIIAFGTIAIAAFTGILWWSTHRLWKAGERQIGIAWVSAEAAKRSADIAYAAQTPRFILTEVTNSYLSTSIKSALVDGQFSVHFRNEGATTAEIIRETITYKITPALDPQPRYPLGDMFEKPIGQIVKPADPYETGTRIHLSDEQRESLVKRMDILWIYGYVEYRDFMDIVWEKGFVTALQTGGNTGRFVSQGPATYTYTKKKS